MDMYLNLSEGRGLEMSDFRWINVFVRDLLLIGVVGAMQYWTHFNSKTVFFISGMMVVWVSWQLSDYMTEIKLSRGLG